MARRETERTIETLALFSDVHGNSLALEAVLDDLGRREITAVYCLGDLVGYGPDPNRVIDLLRSRGVESILGNHDEGFAWETGDCGCFYGRVAYDVEAAAGAVLAAGLPAAERPGTGEPRRVYRDHRVWNRVKDAVVTEGRNPSAEDDAKEAED